MVKIYCKGPNLTYTRRNVINIPYGADNEYKECIVLGKDMNEYILLLCQIHNIQYIIDIKLTDLHESCIVCPLTYCCLQIMGSFAKFNCAACKTLVIMPWQKELLSDILYVTPC